MGAAHELLDRIKDGFLDVSERRGVAASQCLEKAVIAIHLFRGIGGFGDAVAEHDEGFAGIELGMGRLIFRGWKKTHGKRTTGSQFPDLAIRDKQWRRMAGLDVFQIPTTVENAKEQGSVTA